MRGSSDQRRFEHGNEIAVGIADVCRCHCAHIAARLRLLGGGQRLCCIEAHPVVDGGEQGFQTAGTVCSNCWISSRVS